MAINENCLVKKAYLYYIHNDKIVEVVGEIEYRPKCVDDNLHIHPETTTFISYNEHGRIVKYRACSPNEGIIHDKVVWLKEADMNRAASIFITHEEKQISKLEEQIIKRKNLIKSLKED